MFTAYSMIDNATEKMERMRSNIDQECHQWFEDASELASKVGVEVRVPRITGRQVHRNNAPSTNTESHYRISFLDHLLEKMKVRFNEENRVGAEIFGLVPSLIVKRDDLSQMKKKLEFWQHDLPSPSSILFELKEWQNLWQKLDPEVKRPVNLVECLKFADEDQYPNIHIILKVGCTLPVGSAEAERSFSGLRRIKSYLRNRMTDERLAGLALMHLHHDIEIDVNEICKRYIAANKRRLFSNCILYN